MTRVLVTGAGGQLGQCFREVANQYPQFQFDFKEKKDLDITDAPTTAAYLLQNPTQIVINCAAYTAVDAAEQKQEQALLLNQNAVAQWVQWAEKFNFSLLHFSTDYVFDGQQKQPYKEADAVAPLNFYGHSKCMGEQAIFQSTARSICIRTSWLFSPYGKNFVKTIHQKIAENQPLKIVDDQWARPTYGIDLAHASLKLLTQKNAFKHKCYHFANSGVTNWYGLAKAIAQQSRKPADITPVSTSDFAPPAKRPSNSVLDTQRIENMANLVLRSWQEALDECLKKL